MTPQKMINYLAKAVEQLKVYKNLENARNLCPFCRNTGLIKTIDLAETYGLPDGEYELSFLIEKYGEYYPCCEGCIITN